MHFNKYSIYNAAVFSFVFVNEDNMASITGNSLMFYYLGINAEGFII